MRGGLQQGARFPATGTPYTITNVNSGTVLDSVNCETANGTVVRQWAQLDNTCQQWDLAA